MDSWVNNVLGTPRIAWMRSRSQRLCYPAPRWVARSVCSTSRRRYTTTHREQYAQTIHFTQFATLSYPCLLKGLWPMITNPFSLFFMDADKHLPTLILRMLLLNQTYWWSNKKSKHTSIHEIKRARTIKFLIVKQTLRQIFICWIINHRGISLIPLFYESAAEVIVLNNFEIRNPSYMAFCLRNKLDTDNFCCLYSQPVLWVSRDCLIQCS